MLISPVFRPDNSAEIERLRSLETDYVLRILQYNQDLIAEIQKLMSDLQAQNQVMLIQHLSKRSGFPLIGATQLTAQLTTQLQDIGATAVAAAAATAAASVSASVSAPVSASEPGKTQRLTFTTVGQQLVSLIEELREVAEDKELNQKTAEERLNKSLECLAALKELLGLGETMPLERLVAIARDPDTLLEKERDLYYFSVLMTYLNIPPNKHGMKPEHLLWSQEKVRHYIDETRISHIWKEICPLKEWIFHKSLEKRTGKRQKTNDSQAKQTEKRTQYQNWPAVVFPLLLKDHFLYKIRKIQPGIPEPGVVNNTVLAHRRLRRDQERFRKQAKI